MYSEEKLLKMLSSNKTSMRYEACEWLRVRQESSPEIVAALEKATNDADNDVAERAKLALYADVHHQMAMKTEILPSEEIVYENNPSQKGIITRNKCPNCDTVNPSGAQFCNNCGRPLSTVEGVSKKKSKKKLWIILGLGVGVLILAAIFCYAIIGNLSKEANPIQTISDTFMKYLVAKDAESAYALTSPRFQQQVPIDNLQQLINGENYNTIEGYQSLKITNIRVNYGVPQTAEVSGVITYTSTQGEFSATLEKVNNNWMISSFNFRKYFPTQP
jgi:hypothetical protein